MVEETFEQTLKNADAKAEINSTKFIPQPGKTYKVEIVGNTSETTNWSKGGETWEGRIFKVKIEGKEKTWRVFENQAKFIVKANMKHPNHIITVEASEKGFLAS